MSDVGKPVGVHLVGSIPVQTAEEAFRLSANYLTDHLKRMPDGEVGERDTWIRWQHAKCHVLRKKQTVGLRRNSNDIAR